MEPLNGIDLAQYKSQAKELLRHLHASEQDSLERLKKRHPKKYSSGNPRSLKLTDAQLVVARENGFASWPKFSDYLLFRNAVKALDSGDIHTLSSLLNQRPCLIKYRCRIGEWYEQGYFAGATLLNHIAGNPIRCPIPPNVLEIARLLLSKGARDEQPNPRFTIGLLLTSRQASEAKVAMPLIDLIVEASSLVPDLTRSDILDLPLLNDAPDTAEELLRRGARMDIRHAVALGRFDLVKRIAHREKSIEENQALIPLPEDEIASKSLLEAAFAWACRGGRTEIAEYLLELGVDPNSEANTGQPGLHSAAGAGRLNTVLMLLKRKTPLEIKNQYGGTALGQAVWSAINEPHPESLSVIEALLTAGSDPAAVRFPTGNELIDEILERRVAKE